MLTLHVKNFLALREVHWSPTGLCAVIGANGAGKTTLLLGLKLIRAALDRGLPQAVTNVLGGSHGLRHWGAPEDEPVEIGLDVDDLSWRIRLVARGATVDHLADEELRRGDQVIFSKDGLGNFSYRGERWEADERVGLRAIADGPKPDPDVETVLTRIRGVHVFHDPDLWGLRQQGSRTTHDRHLHSRGSNAFTMLRGWYLSRTHRPRFQFVLDGLRAAFPGICEDLDFEEAGQTVTARIFARGREQASPIRSEANGLLAMLVLLCNVAAADEGGLVAIDEPENSLHPYAIREFMRRTSAWARLHGLTTVLTTHSPVLLDELAPDPSQVFVMRADGRGPVRLDEHRDRDWLANFRLGELYADGELGSNDDSA
jgi:predicted ATPase